MRLSQSFLLLLMHNEEILLNINTEIKESFVTRVERFYLIEFILICGACKTFLF